MRGLVFVLAAWAVGCSRPSIRPLASDAVAAPPQPVAAQSLDERESPPKDRAAAAPQPVGALHEVRADDGHVIAVWAKTPAEARGAIVLIHGRTWSGRPDFDLQVLGEKRSTMDALVREGYAAYAVDLRGYGATKRDSSGWNTPDRAARDVVHVLEFVREQSELGSPAVLGWSLGSLTTQLIAQRRPDLVSAAILYGYPRRHGHKYKPGPGGAKAKPAAAKTTAKAAAEDFIAPGVITDRTVEAFVEAALRSDPVRADWRAMDQWNELDAAKLEVPTLLIHGEHDPYAPVRNQAELFTHIGDPDRTHVIVAGGDHAAHLEDTGPRFVHAVVSFLQRPRIGDRPKK